MNAFPPQNQVATVVADPASVHAAIGSRFSARAFLDKPVDKATRRPVPLPAALRQVLETLQ